jgi:repressor LexA
MLTPHQHGLLTYICDYIERQGVAPSYQEMAKQAGLLAKSGIHRLIKGLVERGYIKQIPERARAIEVLKYPDGREPNSNIALTRAEQKMITYLREHPDAFRRVMNHIGIPR